MIKKLRIGRAAARLSNYCARMAQPSLTRRAMPTGRQEKAFTLMELLIVIAIIAILTVAFLPNALNAPKKARDAVRIKKVQDIQTAVEAYTAENGLPPASHATNCFISGAGNPATLVGLEVPVDTSKLKSCSDTDDAASALPGAAGANKFYYRYNSAGGFYIIGALLEVHESANSAAGKAAGDTPSLNPAADFASRDAAKTALIPAAKPGATGTYHLAIGPT